MGVPAQNFADLAVARALKPATGRSRVLRRAMTDAERRLWYHLKRVPVEGTHFRRQGPIGPYIADFVCHRSKLVIEIDGGQHADNAEEDVDRTAAMNAEGYRVVRFWNNEVLGNLEGVLQSIVAEVEKGPTSP